MQPCTYPRIKEATGLVEVNNACQVFYNDCDSSTSDLATAQLKGHSLNALQGSPSTIGYKDAGFNGRRAYIRCSKDNALPKEAQERFIADSSVGWIRKDLDASHSPFLSMPDQLTEVIQELFYIFSAFESREPEP